MATDSTTRFSRTVENYIRYRPGYPPGLLDFMKNELGLTSGSAVADIGSGTGKLTEHFLKNGNLTYAVEPNHPMREAAENLFGHFTQLKSVDGTAEATNLPDHCADFAVAAQAFHWFDRTAARREFLRILKPGGWALIVWNDRNDGRSAFMRAYDDFLRNFSTDLDQIDHRHIGSEQLTPFFGENGCEYREFDYLQRFDLDGVRGRYLSCSYAFDEKHSRYEAAMQSLDALYDEYAENGGVEMWYLTQVYFAQMA